MSVFDPTVPFTAAEARAAGISRATLRGSRYQPLFRGVFVASSSPLTVELRARAALSIHPRSALLSHTTAAELLQIPVPHDPDIHVTVPQAADRRPHAGIRTHVTSHRATWVGRGLRSSGDADLLCELGSVLGLIDLVIAGDQLAAHRGVVPLRSGLVGHRCAGSSHARRAGDLVRERVESPMETRVRLLLLWAGFPEPEINMALAHATGHFRPDLCWPDLRLVIEYDGKHHRDNRSQWDQDIARREWFQAQGWRVLTLIARDVFQGPGDAIERIYRSWRDCGGPAFRMSTQWQRYFPQSRNA